MLCHLTTEKLRSTIHLESITLYDKGNFHGVTAPGLSCL
jgi:hypothetical protein